MGTVACTHFPEKETEAQGLTWLRPGPRPFRASASPALATRRNRVPSDKGVPVEASMGLDPEADTPERAWALLASGHFLTSPGMFRTLHLLHVCQTPMAGHHTALGQRGAGQCAGDAGPCPSLSTAQSQRITPLFSSECGSNNNNRILNNSFI